MKIHQFSHMLWNSNLIKTGFGMIYQTQISISKTKQTIEYLMNKQTNKTPHTKFVLPPTKITFCWSITKIVVICFNVNIPQGDDSTGPEFFLHRNLRCCFITTSIQHNFSKVEKNHQHDYHLTQLPTTSLMGLIIIIRTMS